MLQDNLELPFETLVLGVRVRIERVDITPADEIVAVCRRGRVRQNLPILSLPLPSPRPCRSGVDRGLPAFGVGHVGSRLERIQTDT